MCECCDYSEEEDNGEEEVKEEKDIQEEQQQSTSDNVKRAKIENEGEDSNEAGTIKKDREVRPGWYGKGYRKLYKRKKR